MSFLTDRQSSVIDGDKWWGWGLEVNHQTSQYDSRFEKSTTAGSEDGLAGRGGTGTWWLQWTLQICRFKGKKLCTLFPLNYTLQYFQRFLNRSVVDLYWVNWRFPVHAIKPYGRSDVTVPCFLNHGTRWWSVFSFTSWPLYPQRKRLPPSGHWIRDWLCPRAGLEVLEKRKFSCLSQGSNHDPLSPIP